MDSVEDCGELVLADDRAGKQIAVTGIGNADLSHHLTNDDLDMLIVDINTL